MEILGRDGEDRIVRLNGEEARILTSLLPYKGNKGDTTRILKGAMQISHSISSINEIRERLDAVEESLVGDESEDSVALERIRRRLIRAIAVMDEKGRPNAEDNCRMLWNKDWGLVRQEILDCVNEITKGG